MKQLIILRGAPGSGKSTFIKQNGLEPYTLSPDTLRSLFASPVLTEYIGFTISHANEKKVWNLLKDLLEKRMQNGDFTVIDATHTKAKDFKIYKDLADKYRYRLYCVDFSDISLETLLEQNKKREHYKIVPDESVIKMYERLQTSEIPNGVVTLKPTEFKEKVFFKPIDFSHYKKIHMIGDIHGCFTALNDYFHSSIKDDELYIFLGDYIDRGIENAEVLNFLFTLSGRKNVIFIEGNHERHLWNWSNDKEAKSKEFIRNTQPELNSKGVSKKIFRMFYRNLRQMVYFTYNEKTVLVTHGGLNSIPEEISLVSTEQLIKGVGDYSTEIDSLFLKNTNENVFQVHGHRNIQRYPLQVNDRCFNLEGQVELGGHLRIVTLDENGFTPIEIQNTVFSDRFLKKEIEVDVDNTAFLSMLRGNEYINEKAQHGKIASFNFSPKVFYKGIWDNQTTKARGLFINTETTEIVARSFEKTFNIGEMDITSLESLKKNLVFPLNSYIKENGFLGITGYDSQNDELIIASKSTTSGRFKEYFEDILFKNTTKEQIQKMKEYMKLHNCSFVFEVIDPINDPHIVKYKQPEVVLLDIIERTPQFSKLSYDKLVQVANDIGLKVKKFHKSFKNWDEFEDWYKKVSNNMSIELEGFMVEDADNFTFKVKIPYYNFWKQMRGCKDRIVKAREIKKDILDNPLALEFCNWLESFEDKSSLTTMDIITLREEFLKKKTND